MPYNELEWSAYRRSAASFPPTGTQLEIMVHAINADAKKSSLLHVFGNTREGHSVHCQVSGFLHYLWVYPPKGLHHTRYCELKDVWNSQLRAYGNEPIVAIEQHQRESIFYYKGPAAKETFLKVLLREPRDIYNVRKYLRGTAGPVLLPMGDRVDAVEMFEEEGVDYVGRFTCDIGLVGFGWLVMANYRQNYAHPSTCIFDVEVAVTDITAFTPAHDPKYGDIAPMRILDFDLETLSLDPEKGEVIQIGVQVTETGSFGFRMILDTVLYQGETDSFQEGVVMAQYSDERMLLQGFQRLISAVDYDVSRNFNGRTFDWPFLFDRAALLSLKTFGQLSRLKNMLATVAAPSTFQSNARGTRTFRDADIAGRTDFDICHIARCEEQLKSYKLDSVCREFLQSVDGKPMTKEDVHYTMIPVLYRGSSADRARLAKYCRKDALLPRMIDEKQLYFLRYVELARVCRVTLEDLVQRGQQIKVLMQLLDLGKELGFVLPIKRYSTPYQPDGQYDGGLVLEPDIGFHTKPIACLDFNSLYPAECISENIDYSTLLRPTDAVRMKRERPEDLFEGPAGHCFVTPSVRKGVLCILEERLLAARKVAKGDMKKALEAAKTLTEAGRREEAAKKLYESQVQNARQLAIKLSANSAYGFTGVKINMGGMMPCMEVAETITKCGQRDLTSIVDWLPSRYPNARVRYGDTDSVMVEPGCETVKEAMEWMFRVAEEINKDLFSHRAPMKLAPEKVMFPTEFQAKKHYVSGYYESNPDIPDKLYTRGIETVRRDASEFMADCLQECCELIFIRAPQTPIKDRVSKAVQHAKNTVQSLYLNQVDMHKLLMTKALSKEVEEYSSQQAHTMLAQKMMKRDPSTAPVVGDRIPFIMIGEGGKNVRDLAEDPLYALENELPPNVEYYIENQLRKPLERLFVPIIGPKRTADIFEGGHTRKRVRPLASGAKAPKNSIMAFAIIKRCCASCGTPYDPEVHKHPTLCPDCITEHGACVEVDKKRAYDDVKARYDAQFAVCQACQGSDRDPVLCMARTCPELYKRKGLEFQLKRATKDIEDIALSRS